MHPELIIPINTIKKPIAIEQLNELHAHKIRSSHITMAAYCIWRVCQTFDLRVRQKILELFAVDRGTHINLVQSVVVSCHSMKLGIVEGNPSTAAGAVQWTWRVQR